MNGGLGGASQGNPELRAPRKKRRLFWTNTHFRKKGIPFQKISGHFVRKKLYSVPHFSSTPLPLKGELEEFQSYFRNIFVDFGSF